MKELIFTQQNPQFGKVQIVVRIIGRIIYFKFNNNQYSNQIISQLKEKGAKISLGKDWLQIDLFDNQEVVKFGEKEIVVNETSDEEFEVILSDFYKFQYAKAGFKLESEK